MTQLGMRLPIAQLAEHPTAGSVWKAKHLTNLLLNPHGNSVTFTYYLTIKKLVMKRNTSPRILFHTNTTNDTTIPWCSQCS